MEPWNFISLMATTLFLLLAISSWLGSAPSQSRNYLVFGLLTLAGLSAAPYYNSAELSGLLEALRVVPYTLANLVPIAAALVLFQFFEERDIASPVFWSIAAIAVGLDSIDFIISQSGNWPNDQLLILLFEYLPQLLKIAFLLLAGYALLRSWRADLVQGRFRMRFLILLGVSVIGLEMLVVENLLAIRYQFAFDPQGFHSLWQFALAICLFFVYLRPRSIDWLTLEARASASNGEDGKTQSKARWDKHKRQLEQLIQERQIFRDCELNLASLAKTMGLPEYRLRALINRELGYKNFNVFLNDHRIEAAANDLLDPELAHLPILTIALDTGYRSIAPFNKAFKERKGMTPSEFRRGQGEGERR